MYSIVLAAVLTTGGATPEWHNFGCHGCHGCVGATYNAFSCGGCHGCYGCGGCYGCYGCGGCYGGSGCVGYSCSGSFAYSAYNFYSCSGCGGCWGCYGGTGTYGAAVVVPAPVYAMQRETIEQPRLTLRKPEVMTPRPGTVMTAATVTVLLPTETRLFVDDVAYPGIQDRVTFDTPKLQPERTYFYTLRTETVRDGKVVRDSRRVDVTAGKEVKVEFKDLPVLQSVQR